MSLSGRYLKWRRVQEAQSLDPKLAPLVLLANNLSDSDWQKFTHTRRRWAEGGGLGPDPTVYWVKQCRKELKAQ